MPRVARRARTYVRPKKRWQMSIYNMPIDDTQSDEYHKSHVDVTATNSGILIHRITQNAAATATPTPAVVKTGNVQCKLFINCNPSNTNSTKIQYMVRCYVMYVPEGVIPGMNWPTQHPEYIMAKGLKCAQSYWRAFYGENNQLQQTDNTAIINMQFSSRLKRNLNTGDSLYLIALWEPIAVNCTYKVQGEVQYFACYN